MSLLSRTVVAAVIATTCLTAAEGALDFLHEAETAIEVIRVKEEKRQNEIQQLVCEINEIKDCPVIGLGVPE